MVYLLLWRLERKLVLLPRRTAKAGDPFGAQKLCSTPFRCKLRSERLSGDTTTCREWLDDVAKQAVARKSGGTSMVGEFEKYPRETMLAHASAKTLAETPVGGRRTPASAREAKLEAA